MISIYREFVASAKEFSFVNLPPLSCREKVTDLENDELAKTKYMHLDYTVSENM